VRGPQDELAERLRRRIAEVEGLLNLYRDMLALLEGESMERQEVIVNGRKLGVIERGVNFLILRPFVPVRLTDEAIGYLQEVVNDIAERQRDRWGVEAIDLITNTKPDGTLDSVLVHGLSALTEFARVRLALEYALESSFSGTAEEQPAQP
jgi:hypothetical protein